MCVTNLDNILQLYDITSLLYKDKFGHCFNPAYYYLHKKEFNIFI